MGSLVSAMAFKELIFMAMVGVSMLACPNRDCSCADKSFGECNVPTTVANEVHTESRELCIANCDLFHSIGGCDWILYKGTTTKTNCLMFTNDFEDMTEYLESCNLENFAIKHEDGSCMIDESNASCASPICPNSCKSCKADDPCERYHQTNCVVNPKPTATFPATQDVDTCRLACILDSASNPDTSYGGFDYKEETCMCYDSGDRDCQFEAIQFGVTETDIASCQDGGEPGPPLCLTDAECAAPLLCDPSTGCVPGCRAHADCDAAAEYCDCGDAANDNLGCEDGTKPGQCQRGCGNEGTPCIGGTCYDHACLRPIEPPSVSKTGEDH